MRLIIVMLALLGALLPALAADPSEQLVDPAQEARARALSEELRCLVCQNQSIEASNAQLAKDLRLLVRERITAGDGDDAIKAFLVERYGEFVLLKPRFHGLGVVLWLLPALMLALAGGGAWWAWRRRKALAVPADATLSAEEEARLARLLDAEPSDRDD